MNDDELLQAWIERAIALRDSEPSALSPEQIQSIALELGITQGDLDRLELALEAQLKRGEGYLEHGLWDQAIEEIRDVAALNPRSVPLHLVLARAHQGRWKDRGDEVDRAAAEHLARLCLELEPDRPEPFALIRDLEAPPKRKGWLSPTFTHTGVALVAFGAGWAFAEVAAPTPPWEAHAEAQSVYDAAVDAAGEGEPAAPAALEPPVAFTATDDVPGLRLEVRSGLQSNYSDSSYFMLHALLHNEGELEIEELDLELTFLDADGVAVGAPQTVNAIEDYAPLIRPGDAHYFQVFKGSSPEVRAASLTVQRAKTAPGAQRYAESSPVEFRWVSPPPGHLDVEIRERSVQARADVLQAGRVHFDGVFEIENVGDGTVHSLKIRYIYLDADGNPLGENERYVASKAGDRLFPGDVRLVRDVATVPEPYASYRIELFDLD